MLQFGSKLRIVVRRSQLICSCSTLKHLKFFEACRAPRGICYVDAKGDRSEPEPKDAGILEVKLSTRSKIDVESVFSTDSGITAFILADNEARWPTFEATKQDGAIDSEVFLRRTAASDQERLQQIIKELVVGSMVVSFGLAGIGKSTEMNALLMDLLSSVGKEGYPKTVLYRHPFKMFEYSLDANDLPQVKVFRAETLLDVHRITEDYKGKKAVLLLELHEEERDPTSEIPMVVSVSTRAADEVTKTIRKSNNNLYTLMSPPSLQQVTSMAGWMYLLGKTRLSDSKHPFYDLSLKEALAKTKERLDKIGPTVRHVFARDSLYKDQFAILRSSDNLAQTLKDVANSKLSVFNTPKEAKYYMAPYVLPGCSSFTGDDNHGWTYQPLSEYCRERLQNTICMPDELKALNRLGYSYQSEEKAVALFLIGDYTPHARLYSFSKNGDLLFEREAGGTGRNPTPVESMFHSHPLRTIIFEGVDFHESVEKLQGSALYEPRMHNFGFCDRFYVDHKQKLVYAFQVSAKPPCGHKSTMTLDAARSFMRRLDMFEGSGKEYKLAYVYCINSAVKAQFKAYDFESATTETGTGIETATTEAKTDIGNGEDNKMVASRILKRLLAVHYYPSMTEFIPKSLLLQEGTEKPSNVPEFIPKSQWSLVDLKQYCKKHELTVTRQSDSGKGAPKKADYLRVALAHDHINDI